MNQQDPKISVDVKIIPSVMDELKRRFREECEKLPPLPPGYMYVSEMSDAHFEGDRCVIDMSIKIKPIIKSETV